MDSSFLRLLLPKASGPCPFLVDLRPGRWPPREIFASWTQCQGFAWRAKCFERALGFLASNLVFQKAVLYPRDLGNHHQKELQFAASTWCLSLPIWFCFPMFFLGGARGPFPMARYHMLLLAELPCRFYPIFFGPGPGLADVYPMIFRLPKSWWLNHHVEHSLHPYDMYVCMYVCIFIYVYTYDFISVLAARKFWQKFCRNNFKI